MAIKSLKLLNKYLEGVLEKKYTQERTDLGEKSKDKKSKDENLKGEKNKDKKSKDERINDGKNKDKKKKGEKLKGEKKKDKKIKKKKTHQDSLFKNTTEYLDSKKGKKKKDEKKKSKKLKDKCCKSYKKGKRCKNCPKTNDKTKLFF